MVLPPAVLNGTEVQAQVRVPPHPPGQPQVRAVLRTLSFFPHSPSSRA